MTENVYLLSIGNSIVHASDDSLSRFWTTLEEEHVHPLATFAHRKQESLILCESDELAQSLAQKLQQKLGRTSSEVSVTPYTLSNTSSCLLLPTPRYSSRLLNFVGWTETELCTGLTELFSNFSPKPGSDTFGPIVQSLKIEALSSKYSSCAIAARSKLKASGNAQSSARGSTSDESDPSCNEARYHVRIELRMDDTHEVLDDDEWSRTLWALRDTYSQSLRQQHWFGALQLQRQKTFLFYSKTDFTGIGMRDTVIEDPQSIQESFAPHVLSSELVLLSLAIERMGYRQQLYIDGTAMEDDKKRLVRTPSKRRALNDFETLLTLSSVLDSLEKRIPIDDIILIHLDTAGLHKPAAMRVDLRIDASQLNPTGFLQREAEIFEQIIALRTLHTDIFHLIGHLPTDIDEIFDSIFEEPREPANPVSTSPLSPTHDLHNLPHFTSISFGPSADDNSHKTDHLIVNTRTESLSGHSQFLSEVFSQLAKNSCKILSFDAQRLITALDVVITMEPPLTEILPHLPNSTHIHNYPMESAQSSSLYAFTVISSRINSVCLGRLVAQTAGHVSSFSHVRQLSIGSDCRESFTSSPATSHNGRNATEDEVAAHHEVDSLELLVMLTPSSIRDLSALRKTLARIGLENGADVSVQKECFARRNRRAATFDMDSTLIQLECIDEMAVYCGVGDQVKHITHRAMSGELDFKGALRERVELLKGADAEQLFAHVLRSLAYTPNAKFMCHTLRALGCEMAVLSGGFFPIISTVKAHLKLQHARANVLEIDEAGKLTGNLLEEAQIIDADAKERYLRKICTEAHIPLNLSLAVGDGANDLKMLNAAGVGIAFLAKPAVQEKTSFHINQLTLSPVLSLLGLSRDDCIILLEEGRE